MIGVIHMSDNQYFLQNLLDLLGLVAKKRKILI